MNDQEDNMKFDAWEYPQKCVKCGRQDNCDKKEPVTILDAHTKLCEFCFINEEDEEEK